MAIRHMLGGRAFLTVQETSVTQDHLVLQLIREGGIDQVIMGPEESPEDFGRTLLETALKGGIALRLLGCLLVPQSAVPRKRWGRRADPGDVWTPEMAEETADYLGTIRDRAEKAKVNSLVLSVLISFFDLEIISLKRSAILSTEMVPEPAGKPEDQKGATGSGQT